MKGSARSSFCFRSNLTSRPGMRTSGILGERFPMTEASKTNPLPVRPNIERLRNEAKQRLASMKTQSAAARLSDAQFLVACGYGFSSWQALKAEVDRRCRMVDGTEKSKQLPLAVVFRPQVLPTSPHWFGALGELQQQEQILFVISILLMSIIQFGAILRLLLLSVWT